MDTANYQYKQIFCIRSVSDSKNTQEISRSFKHDTIRLFSTLADFLTLHLKSILVLDCRVWFDCSI